MKADGKSIVDSLSKKELSMLLDFSLMLNSTLEIKIVLRQSLELLTELVDAEASSIWLIDELYQELYVVSATGEKSKEIKKVRIDIGNGIVGQVISEGRGHCISNAGGIARKVDFGAKTILCVPMFYKSKVIGAIQALNKEGGEFNEVDVLRASFFANMVGIAIGNAKLYDLSQQENIHLRRELGRSVVEFDDIIGESPELKDLKEKARIAAQRDSNLLIFGETGTGKGLLAEAIHRASPRFKGPFIKVTCGALPKELLESELFGHEKGSFTGSISQRQGRFELANGGTIFLDEVGDMPPSLQVKLLRVIEEKTFERVGGEETIETDCRIIAATNKDLEEKMRAGTFREDLYFRLDVIPLSVLPLRKRKEDIPLLAEHFLKKYNMEMSKNIKEFSPEAMNILTNYSWPGNIRELQNVIENTVVFADSEIIQVNNLPPKIHNPIEELDDYSGPMKEAIIKFKKKIITETLKQTDGNRTIAAEKLDIQRTYLSRLISELDIDA